MNKDFEFSKFLNAVDAVVFTYDNEVLKILLIKRGIEPFKDQWALPGGFLRSNETLEMAINRELKEEANIGDIFLEQLHSFSSVNRDPRSRVITTAYYALVNCNNYEIKANTDAIDAKWFLFNSIPKLAFDHNLIVDIAIKRLRRNLEYKPIGFELLAKYFTISQIQKLYETIFNKKIDKRNFRKKLLKTELIIETDKFDKTGIKRPARLYFFNKDKYNEFKKEGFKFKIL